MTGIQCEICDMPIATIHDDNSDSFYCENCYKSEQENQNIDCSEILE